MGDLDHAASETLTAIANNTKELARLALEGYTDADLADYYDVPAEALRAQFDAILRKARAELRSRARLAFLRAADQGNSDALAYLARRYLEVNAPESG